jgi:hypothetical protein
MWLGVLMMACGVGIGGRFLYYFALGEGSGKVQSLLLAVVLSVVGMQTILTGFLADVMGHNRGLSEDVLFRVKRMELVLGSSAAAAKDSQRRREASREHR